MWPSFKLVDTRNNILDEEKIPHFSSTGVTVCSFWFTVKLRGSYLFPTFLGWFVFKNVLSSYYIRRKLPNSCICPECLPRLTVFTYLAIAYKSIVYVYVYLIGGHFLLLCLLHIWMLLLKSLNWKKISVRPRIKKDMSVCTILLGHRLSGIIICRALKCCGVSSLSSKKILPPLIFTPLVVGKFQYPFTVS